jgi:hypothetical protein
MSYRMSDIGTLSKSRKEVSQFDKAPSPINKSKQSQKTFSLQSKEPSLNTEPATGTASITLYDRNEIFPNGTYQQAHNELREALEPIIDNVQQLYGPQTKDSDAFTLRHVVEGNVHDIKQFDTLLDKVVSNINKDNLGYRDIQNLNTLFKILKNSNQPDPQSREGMHFTQSIQHFDKQLQNTVLNSPEKRIQFVVNLLKGIDKIEKLEHTVNQLKRSPLNKNADLKLFSSQLGNAVQSVQTAGSNITAYAQNNAFDENELQKRVTALPNHIDDFTNTIADIAQNPQIKNNPEYIDLVSALYKDTMQVMKFFTPELEQAILKEEALEKHPDSLLSESGKNNFYANQIFNDTVSVAKETDQSDISQPKISQDHTQQRMPTAQAVSDDQSSNIPMAEATLLPQTQGNRPQGNDRKDNAVSDSEQKANLVSDEIVDKYTYNTPVSSIKHGALKDIYSNPPPQNPDYVSKKADNVKNLLGDYPSATNMSQTGFPSNKQLESLQELWGKAYQSKHQKNQMNAMNEISQNLEDIAMSGSGRPNPEKVAFAKRTNRLKGLQDLMKSGQDSNKLIQNLEKSALEAQNAQMTGINQIATQRLKNEVDSAHMNSEQHKAYAKGVEKLGLDGLEIATNMAKNHEKILGLFNQITDARINNVWDNMKRLVRGFKF